MYHVTTCTICKSIYVFLPDIVGTSPGPRKREMPVGQGGWEESVNSTKMPSSYTTLENRQAVFKMGALIKDIKVLEGAMQALFRHLGKYSIGQKIRKIIGLFHI